MLFGDNSGNLLHEFAMTDTGDREKASWLEPILKGDVPEPCKACCVASSGNKIFMFGGMRPNAEDQMTATNELVVFEITGPNDLVAVVNPPTVGSAKPPARSYGMMQEYSNGKIFVYGGLDVNGKALNDGWFLDVPTMSWEFVYNGHSDLVLPTGSVATLLAGKLVVLNSATGSPKLDIASSLDFVAIREAMNFTDKMKVEAVHLLERLEEWTEKQRHAMEMARNLDKLGQSFDSLLKVMDSLFQVRSRVQIFCNAQWTTSYNVSAQWKLLEGEQICKAG